MYIVRYVVLLWLMLMVFVFFFKQKTAYEMRISDWSSDVCSSDLLARIHLRDRRGQFVPIGMVRNDERQFDHVLPRALAHPHPARRQIGRASCRERVCQYV